MLDKKRVKLISKPIVSVIVDGVEHKFEQPMIVESFMVVNDSKYGMAGVSGFSLVDNR